MNSLGFLLFWQRLAGFDPAKTKRFWQMSEMCKVVAEALPSTMRRALV